MHFRLVFFIYKVLASFIDLFSREAINIYDILNFIIIYSTDMSKFCALLHH